MHQGACLQGELGARLCRALHLQLGQLSQGVLRSLDPGPQPNQGRLQDPATRLKPSAGQGCQAHQRSASGKRSSSCCTRSRSGLAARPRAGAHRGGWPVCPQGEACADALRCAGPAWCAWESSELAVLQPASSGCQGATQQVAGPAHRLSIVSPLEGLPAVTCGALTLLDERRRPESPSCGQAALSWHSAARITFMHRQPPGLPVWGLRAPAGRLAPACIRPSPAPACAACAAGPARPQPALGPAARCALAAWAAQLSLGPLTSRALRRCRPWADFRVCPLAPAGRFSLSAGIAGRPLECLGRAGAACCRLAAESLCPWRARMPSRPSPSMGPR